jgi:predicted DCC family thiol-disulfide oxidoreductase YuxK
MTEAVAKPIMLYDGECGFCNASVQFVLRHERRHDLLFAPQQGATGRHLFAQHQITTSGPGSVVLIENGAPHFRSDATLRIMRLMGGPWRALAALGRLIPPPLRDYAYDVVAKNRGKLSCSLKGRAQALDHNARFLDEPSDHRAS